MHPWLAFHRMEHTSQQHTKLHVSAALGVLCPT